LDPHWWDSLYYFKAGSYCQCSEEQCSAGEACGMRVYALNTTHFAGPGWPPQPPPLPPASPPPPPPPPFVTIPPDGVAVLHGGEEELVELYCLRPQDEARTALDSSSLVPHLTIATQCCETDGMCHRMWDVASGKASEDPADCLVGHSETEELVERTYAEAAETCAGLGLVLCTSACYNAGCNYNAHPVYSNLPCTQR